MKRAAAIFACLVFVSGGVRAEQLTNADVISLVKAGMAQELIVSKIKSDDNAFDVKATALVELRQAGVTDPVIQVMIDEAQKRQKTRESSISLQIQSLASDVPETRQFAYIALMRAGPLAQERMTDALSNFDPKVRAAVISAFLKMDKKDAVTLIRVMLEDQASVVRLAAAEFLAEYDASVSGRKAQDRISRWRIDRPGDSIDADIRLVGLVGRKEALPAIRVIIQESSNEDVRLQGIWAVGEMQDVAAREVLNRLLMQDRSAKVRLNSAQVLAGFPGNEGSVDAIKHAIDIDETNRPALLELAPLFPVKRLAPALITLLAEKMPESHTEAAVAALRRMTHQDFGRDVSKWLAWWEKNEEHIDKPIQPELDHAEP